MLYKFILYNAVNLYTSAMVDLVPYKPFTCNPGKVDFSRLTCMVECAVLPTCDNYGNFKITDNL